MKGKRRSGRKRKRKNRQPERPKSDGNDGLDVGTNVHTLIRESWYLAPNSWIVAQKRDALSARTRNRQRGRDAPLAPQMAAGEWEAADSPTEHMVMESAELVRLLSPELKVQDGGISCQITNPRCKGCPSICPTTGCYSGPYSYPGVHSGF